MTLQELKRLREQVGKRLSLDAGVRFRLLVSMGTDGIAVGAREVARALREELARRALKGVELVEAGGRGLSYAEPLVEVRERGKDPILYRNVTPEIARRIVAEHLAGGRPVSEYLLEPGP